MKYNDHDRYEDARNSRDNRDYWMNWLLVFLFVFGLPAVFIIVKTVLDFSCTTN